MLGSGTRKVKEKTWSHEGEVEEEMILNMAVSRGGVILQLWPEGQGTAHVKMRVESLSYTEKISSRKDLSYTNICHTQEVCVARTAHEGVCTCERACACVQGPTYGPSHVFQ